MKKQLLLLLLAPFLYNCALLNQPGAGGNAGGGSTRNPNVNGTAADYTEITKVTLTDRYTIINVTHTNNNRVRRDPASGRIINNGMSEIRIKPSTRLIGLNGQRSFRFVKAEGIPVDPQVRKSYPGDRVNFVLYFERLDPGIEIFDLFECNDYDNMVCWNFYGVKVINPAAKENTPPVVVNTPTTKIPGEVEIPTQKPQVFVKEVVVRGVVRDAKTLKPVTARIDYMLLPKNTPIDSIQSFSGSGEYKVRLQNNQVYTYTVHAPGYLALSDNIDLTKAIDGQTITRDILLKSFVVGDKITLKNLFFEVSKYDLLPASFAELDKLVGFMNDYPTMEIGLEGHTDVVGDKDANLQLSKDRVNEVKKYLVSKGIADRRITATGYGSTKPIVAKGTDEERKVNRRVEFVILKN